MFFYIIIHYNEGDKMKLNNKGFTLVEILAVVAIIAILGLVAIPSVISTINTGKKTAYNTMISNVVTASQILYEEIEYGIDLKKYDLDGATNEQITIINDEKITINLQTLVSNGFLSGTNNECTATCTNNNKKIIYNPETKEDIGDCEIIITKSNNNNKIKYTVTNKDDTISKCPSEYKEVNND